MKRNVRIAKELVKLAKSLVAGGPVSADGIAKMFMNALQDDTGYYYMEMPSGRMLCMEGGVEDGKKYVDWYLNSHVDMMGEPYGILLEDLGTIYEGDDMAACRRLADWAIKEDAAYTYQTGGDFGVTEEQFLKWYIQRTDFWNSDLSPHGQGIVEDHVKEIIDLVNAKGGNVWDAVYYAMNEVVDKYE